MKKGVRCLHTVREVDCATLVVAATITVHRPPLRYTITPAATEITSTTPRHHHPPLDHSPLVHLEQLQHSQHDVVDVAEACGTTVQRVQRYIRGGTSTHGGATHTTSGS